MAGKIGRGLLGGATAFTAAALTAACGGGLPGASPIGVPKAASVSASPTPTSTALSDSEYATRLAAIDQPVSAALAKLAKSGAKADLAAVAAAASAAADQLDGLAAPAGAGADNSALSRDLAAVGSDLTDLGGGSGCAAALPAVEAGSVPSVVELAAEAKRMAAAGHPSGLTVPAFPKARNRSLHNGSYVHDADRSGNGKLTIENGGSGDAVITLRRSGKRSVAVYLRKNAKYTVKGMRDGTYAVYFATGADWDAAKKGFTRSCAYQKFEKPLKFSTKYTSRYIEYTTYTISLYAVAGGTASTTDIPPAQFPAP